VGQQPKFGCSRTRPSEIIIKITWITKTKKKIEIQMIGTVSGIAIDLFVMYVE
jgi:hypothetical protein